MEKILNARAIFMEKVLKIGGILTEKVLKIKEYDTKDNTFLLVRTQSLASFGAEVHCVMEVNLRSQRSARIIRMIRLI